MNMLHNHKHGSWNMMCWSGMEWNGIESINEIDHMEFNGSYGIKMNHVQFNQ